MSNTSYPFKENSNVMNVQGGEKKVMKKILTVALSTAMAFSMFASVAFGDTAVTPQQKFDALAAKGIFNGYPDQQAHLEKEMTRAEFAKVITKLLGLKEVTGTLSYKDKGYDAKNWAVPYIEAVTAAGIMQGQDNVKKIFNYNGKVTIQEMATVLTRALKLEIPANPNNNAADWAKGYVQAAIDKGLISKDANFKANASRSQLVEAAYAIDQAANITFTYKVVDPSNVEFTLSTGEVVKVKLDKPLEANKETEVKFKDAAGNEYTAKVTWAVTSATKVDSASAANLKQVVVTFDGTLDPASAGNKNNYVVDGKTIDSVTVGADKKSVTILLAEGSTLTNQKQTFVQVNNVKSEGAAKTITQKVEFTALDVTVPEVQSVTALGTKAFKVKFSEPVQPTDLISSNFRVDDKTIAANVKYAYPDTVIVTTNLSEGQHTLRVSGVKDYSNLAVVPVAKDFTVTQDTTAPKVVSTSSYDLKEVTVEFDETVKSVSSAYANVSSIKADSITINDNKVTLHFPQALSYSENTVHIAGVKDYSDNSGDVDVTVTPSLDVTRPTVVATAVSQENANGDYVAEVQFSKAVNKDDAQDRSKYVLKDSAGNVAKVSGVNSNGNPIRQPQLSTDGKKVTINFGPGLANDDYTLTISGIRDTSYVGNVLLPYTATLSVKDAVFGQINRAWSQGQYVYVQFNKTLSTSGAGNAADPAKYTIDNKPLTYNASDVEFVSTDTVRVFARNFSVAELTATPLPVITASYIQDANGNYLRSSAVNGGYNLFATINGINKAVQVEGTVKANSINEVSVSFNGPLNSVDASEFVLTDTANANAKYTATDYSLSADNKTVTLKFGDKIPTNFAGTLAINGSVTRDSFGNVVNVPTVAVANKIKPEFSKFDTITAVKGATETTYTIPVVVTKNVDAASVANNLFTVKIGTSDTEVISATAANSNTIIVKATVENSATGEVYVKFNGDANADSKAVVDHVDQNALAGFEKYSPAVTATPADTTAPTVTAHSGQLPVGTTTLTFSEPLDATSKDAVKTAIEGAAGAQGATVAFDTTGKVATITATAVSTYAADVTAVVSDAVGNSATVTLIDLP
ncbi:hypothetical protein BK138_28340 [Paenibacillus rhizosphaerae]|uniref:SLH domain-containing protein n=1 Tax=Paenibacillus rhizosphaerae TaxID=297318 RepID=A0A1R1EEF6_9BACL|nr:Ig-like domain-containing protein [Paenibacillus rhizosphaerae]OMF50196.1 hypothetical protein BK138_28340 [Paenibacillus rhizosphaerae]